MFKFFLLQASYLVGIADPASEYGRPGLVDQSQFARANQAIQMACQNLTNPASTQQQVGTTCGGTSTSITVFIRISMLSCIRTVHYSDDYGMFKT